MPKYPDFDPLSYSDYQRKLRQQQNQMLFEDIHTLSLPSPVPDPIQTILEKLDVLFAELHQINHKLTLIFGDSVLIDGQFKTLKDLTKDH